MSDSITYTNNIIYSGDMNVDFNAADDTLEKINTIQSITSGATTGDYVQFAVKIKYTKWEIIKHYILSGDLSNITVSFATVHPILVTKTFTVASSSVNLTLDSLSLVRPFSDVDPSEIVPPHLANTYLNFANSSVLTITLS